MHTLYPYQRTGVEFLKSRNNALLADEMGLGKTLQAITAASELGAKKILVICPASVKINWVREISPYFRHLSVFMVKSKAENIPNFDIVVCNYDLVIDENIRRQLTSRKWSIVICDEAHYLKSYNSQRAAAVLGSSGVAVNAVYRWMLTGTPVLNRPIELYTMLSTLYPEVVPNMDYEQYALKYCSGFWTPYNTLDVRGASNIKELSAKLEGFMLRRTKKEVMSELPEKIFEMVRLPMSPEMDAVLEEEIELQEKAANGDISALGILATIRRKTAIAKVKMVVEDIENTLAQTEKLFVVAYHREVMDLLCEKLSKYNPTSIRGGMSAEEKEASKSCFVQRKDCRVLIGQITSAGQGIDGLQNVCDSISFAEVSWTPGENRQIADRLHRIGQKGKSVLIRFLIAEGTVEEQIVRTIIKKEKIIDQIIKEK